MVRLTIWDAKEKDVWPRDAIRDLMVTFSCVVVEITSPTEGLLCPHPKHCSESVKGGGVNPGFTSLYAS